MPASCLAVCLCAQAAPAGGGQRRAAAGAWCADRGILLPPAGGARPPAGGGGRWWPLLLLVLARSKHNRVKGGCVKEAAKASRTRRVARRAAGCGFANLARGVTCTEQACLRWLLERKVLLILRDSSPRAPRACALGRFPVAEYVVPPSLPGHRCADAYRRREVSYNAQSAGSICRLTDQKLIAQTSATPTSAAACGPATTGALHRPPGENFSPKYFIGQPSERCQSASRLSRFAVWPSIARCCAGSRSFSTKRGAASRQPV